MDLLSGGVDEDLYNDLYENETALDNNDSFLESPVLLSAALTAQEAASLMNAVYASSCGDSAQTFASTYGYMPVYCAADGDTVFVCGVKSGDTTDMACSGGSLSSSAAYDFISSYCSRITTDDSSVTCTVANNSSSTIPYYYTVVAAK